MFKIIYICHTAMENLLNCICQSLGHKSFYKRSQAGNINARAKGDNSHPKSLLPSKQTWRQEDLTGIFPWSLTPKSQV